MDLKEYEGRALFIKHGITVPRGFLVRKVSSRNDLVQTGTLLRAFLHGAPDIGRFALKAQLLSGKRGKGGGIIFSDVKNCVRDIGRLQGKTVNGEKVKEVLAVEALDIAKEYYLAVTVDRNAGRPVMIFSDCGGIDIEETAEKNPEHIMKVDCVDTKSFPKKELQKLAEDYFGDKSATGESTAEYFIDIAKKLFDLFATEDFLLVEINPLILTKKNVLYAADAKITLDDSSVYRHPENARYMKRGHSVLESDAAKYGLSYVELDGDLAIIGNGAGLVMATLDAVKRFGADPANFCDLGGGASEMMVEKAMEIVLKKRSVRTIFINIFGGITRCDEVARGIVRFFTTRKKKIPPMVVRLVGTNEKEGVKVLSNAGIKAFTGFGDAARAAGGLARGASTARGKPAHSAKPELRGSNK
jgi:succinyl-CoA synthetase beta subunit